MLSRTLARYAAGQALGMAFPASGKTAVAVILLIVALGEPLPATAEIDDVQASLLTQFDLPLRWDNIENGPHWVAGASPVYSRELHAHVIRLAPGETVTVRVPEGEMLRLLRKAGPWREAEVEVLLSNGSGLYASMPLAQSPDGRSLLAQPDLSEPGLARIAAGHRAIEFGLFVSRREPLDEVAPYRGLVILSGKRHRLRRRADPAGQDYWHLAAGAEVLATVRGPARYALEGRLDYPPEEHALVQTWKVEAQLDGRPLRVLDFESVAESTHPVFIDGRERLLSRHERGFLDVPEGKHLLKLSSSGPMFLRILKQEVPDYLLPSLNAPALSAAEVRFSLGSPIRDRDLPGAVEQRATRLARDNARREGGIVGAALFLEHAARRPDYPVIAQRAQAFAGAHGFFRDLLPQHKRQRASTLYAWFVTPRLLEIGEHGRDFVAGAQHREALLDRLASGFFLALPTARANTSSAQAQRYVLPPRFAPTQLRIAALSELGQRFWIQFDDAPPRSLWIEPPPERPVDEYLPSAGELGLALLAARFSNGGSGSGAFAFERTPGPLQRASVIELQLAPEVREIRMWREREDLPPLQLALQYRAARPFALTEQAYHYYLRRLRIGRKPVVRFRELLSGKAAATDGYTQEVHSHWQPLARLIAAEYRHLLSSVPPPVWPDGEGGEGLMKRAQAREQAGEWLPALEAWGEVYFGSRGGVAVEAAFGQARALAQLGEDHLAEQRLRQLLLYGETLNTRRRANRALAAMYRADPEALQALAAASFHRDGEAERLAELGQALLDNDQPELGLVVASLLPEEAHPQRLALRAAYRLRWWRTIEDAARLDRDEYALWRGLRLLGSGEPAAAAQAFAAGRQGARAYGEHLRRGEQIRRDLGKPRAQAAALSDWAAWQLSHPGPRVMRPAPELIEDYAGAQLLYSLERDLYGLYFRAEAERPVRLRLYGPTKLRIEARPVHPHNAEEPLEGWLKVASGERLYVTPILNNWPATGLRVAGETARVPGRKVTMELSFAPGEHEAMVSAGDGPVLVRVYAEQPEHSLRVLPPLCPAAVPAALSGRVQTLGRGTAPSCRARCLVLVPNAGARSAAEWRPMPHTFATNAAVRSLAAQLPAAAPMTPADREAMLFRRGQWTKLIDTPAGETPEEVRQRLAQILWIAEHEPALYERALAAGLALAAAHRGLPGVGALVDRLTRGSAWQPLLTVDSSAGLRAITMPQWESESPALRARRALLPPLAPGEQLISGANRLVMTLNPLASTEIALDLSSEIPLGLRRFPLTVKLEQDGEPLGRVTLSADRPRLTRRLALPPGRHVLRLSFVRPYANQFLRLRLIERQRVRLLAAEERLYHLATEAQPLLATVAGPAWLRIDEWRDGETLIRYRHIAGEWETVRIPPQAGRDEALLRLFVRRGAATQGEPPPPALVLAALEEVPEPPFSVAARPWPRRVDLHDAFGLGGQEDGTWTLSASYHDRPYRDELDNRGTEQSLRIDDREKFWEASAAYRTFDQARQSYTFAEALGRVREQGAPVLGLRGAWHYRPRWRDWNLGVVGSLYVQPVDPEGLPSVDGGEIAHSHFLSATIHQVRAFHPKTDHRPQLTVFHRFTSEDEDLGIEDRSSRQALSRFIDQDVFTRYKALSPFGVTLADTLYHRPWLDTWWYTGVQLTTNVNPFETPDALAASVGWRQRIGPATLEAGYTLTRFFADADRAQSFTRPRLDLDLTLERWLPGLERAELDFSFRHDFENDESAFTLWLRWHFSKGRAYRDFDFGPLAFRDLRERHVPHEVYNNRLEPLFP